MAKLAPNELHLRPVTTNDLMAVTEVHCAAFPASAMTALGKEAVRRYYLWQLEGPHEVTAYAALRGERMAGFYFGGVFRGALGGFLARERAYLAWCVITHPWLILNPLFRDRLGTATRVLRKKISGKTALPAVVSPPTNKPRQFGILAIAAHPDFHGLGVGYALMTHAENAAKAAHFPEMQLNVSPDNQQAIRFYEKLGWQRIQKPGEAWKGDMIKPLA